MCSELKAREQYIGRVEEARRWLEYTLKEELPPVAEFESSLLTGATLCKLGRKFTKHFDLQNEEVYSKQRKFMKFGIKHKVTNQSMKEFMSFTQATGLPKKLCPPSKSPKAVELVYCLHGLSFLLKLKGCIDKSVEDFSLEKNPLEYKKIKSAAAKVLSSGLAVIMPSFNIVGPVVQEELQASCISLSQENSSSEEDLAHCTSPARENRVPTVESPIFDDPIYAQPLNEPQNHSPNNQKSLFDDPDYEVIDTKTRPPLHPPRHTSPPEPLIAELPCNLPGVTAKILECTQFEPEPTLREGAIFVINIAIDNKDDEALLAALRDPNAQLPYVHNNENHANVYLTELLKEKERQLPQTTTCIYKGLSRDMCQQYIDKMAPGAFLIREVNSEEKKYLVISFRNQTVTKHWKVLLEDGKYCLSDTDRFVQFQDFIQHFSETLHQQTKLHVHQGTCPGLLVQQWRKVPKLVQLAESGNSLSPDQIEAVVKRVNTLILRERRASREVTRKSLVYFCWTDDMLMRVSRDTAERLLKEYGKPGNFIVRPSQELDAFAISFRTNLEHNVIHWKVLKCDGKYTIHPRPHKYNTLQEVVMTFVENLFEKTGLKMKLPSLPAKVKYELVAEGVSPSHPSLQSSDQRGFIGSGSGSGSPINQNRFCHSTLNPVDVASWSVGDVSHWLGQVGLEEFRESFETNSIDGECLLSLDLAQLREDLNILPLGHRHKILRRIALLREQ